MLPLRAPFGVADSRFLAETAASGFVEQVECSPPSVMLTSYVASRFRTRLFPGADHSG